jgi:chemotaxis signal transduction protein
MSLPADAGPSATSAAIGDRLLAFELCGTLFALPIADVAEVTDLVELAHVPMVHRKVGGVVNHHGDAVPIVYGDALFETERTLYPRSRPLLILAKDPDDPNRYGVPVDSIWGLIDGPPAIARGEGPIAERRPEGGRMVSILDPKSLLERAMEVIATSVAKGATGSMHRGMS